MVKHGRDQSFKISEHIDNIQKAIKDAEREVFQREGRWYVTTTDIRKHTSLSLTTIYEAISYLSGTEQKPRKPWQKKHWTRKTGDNRIGWLKKVGPRRYSSHISILIRTMAEDIMMNDTYQELISNPDEFLPWIALDEYLSLVSSPYHRAKRDLNKLRKNKALALLRIRELYSRQSRLTRVTEEEKEKFLPLQDMIEQSTSLKLLSSLPLAPYPDQRGTEYIDPKNAFSIYLTELRKALWKMLILYVLNPSLPLEKSGLAILIRFQPKKDLMTEEFKKQLQTIDRTRYYENKIQALHNESAALYGFYH